jgi:hypothetical protein
MIRFPAVLCSADNCKPGYMPRTGPDGVEFRFSKRKSGGGEYGTRFLGQLSGQNTGSDSIGLLVGVERTGVAACWARVGVVGGEGSNSGILLDRESPALEQLPVNVELQPVVATR